MHVDDLMMIGPTDAVARQVENIEKVVMVRITGELPANQENSDNRVDFLGKQRKREQEQASSSATASGGEAKLPHEEADSTREKPGRSSRNSSS